MDNNDQNQETTYFMPVIPRLDRLDRLLHLLEEKHSLSRRDFSSRSFASTTTMATEYKEDHEFKTVSSALEEVQHKGTLVERLSALENRVLQLGLDMDGDNTSTPSSSTVQVCDQSSIPNKQQDHINQVVIRKEMQDPQVKVKMQEGASTTTRICMEERNGKVKSSGQKVKAKRKWIRLFRIRLRC